MNKVLIVNPSILPPNFDKWIKMDLKKFKTDNDFDTDSDTDTDKKISLENIYNFIIISKSPNTVLKFESLDSHEFEIKSNYFLMFFNYCNNIQLELSDDYDIYFPDFQSYIEFRTIETIFNEPDKIYIGVDCFINNNPRKLTFFSDMFLVSEKQEIPKVINENKIYYDLKNIIIKFVLIEFNSYYEFNLLTKSKKLKKLDEIKENFILNYQFENIDQNNILSFIEDIKDFIIKFNNGDEIYFSPLFKDNLEYIMNKNELFNNWKEFIKNYCVEHRKHLDKKRKYKQILDSEENYSKSYESIIIKYKKALEEQIQIIDNYIQLDIIKPALDF
jgi:hypothetical protein